jgi:hypothetical protein
MSFLLPTSGTTARRASRLRIQLASLARLWRCRFRLQRDVLVTGVNGPLVPVQETRLSIMREGLHYLERARASLVLLPQQFSNCIKASNENVRNPSGQLDIRCPVVFGEGGYVCFVEVRYVFAAMLACRLARPIRPSPTGKQGLASTLLNASAV